MKRYTIRSRRDAKSLPVVTRGLTTRQLGKWLMEGGRRSGGFIVVAVERDRR